MNNAKNKTLAIQKRDRTKSMNSEHKAGKINTTVAIKITTKARLDRSRAPGQCYDGFISELVNYWERYRICSSLCSPGKPIYVEDEREG